MNLNDHYRELGRGWDLLADATEHTRPSLLIDQAERFEELAAAPYGGNHDTDAAILLHLLADVELVATGKLSRRHATSSRFEAALGPILDRMALTTELKARAVMLGELSLDLDDNLAEILAGMPYCEGRGGWTADESMPSERSLKGFFGALRVVWRSRRAAR